MILLALKLAKHLEFSKLHFKNINQSSNWTTQQILP